MRISTYYVLGSLAEYRGVDVNWLNNSSFYNL